MGTTPGGAPQMGDAYPCHLDLYFRTIVYGLPHYVVQDGALPPVVLTDTGDFRAALVTDPVAYLKESDFSDQFRSYENSAARLEEKLEKLMRDDERCVFVVIQIRQNLGSFPAIGGQCQQFRGVPFFLNLGDPDVPAIDDTANSINAVLTAIRLQLDVTGGFDKHLDTQIYRTDDGKFVPWMDMHVSASAVADRLIGADDFTAKATGADILVDKINRVLSANTDNSDMNPKKRQNMADRLEELIDALQLDPTGNDAYRRLWYLKLWHHADKYGKTLKPRLQLLNEHDLKAEKDHRNAIAHPGVERADSTLLRSFQQKLFRIIREHI